MELVLLLILWLISPIILGIVCGSQHGKIKRLEEEIAVLKGERPAKSCHKPPEYKSAEPLNNTAEKPDPMPATASVANEHTMVSQPQSEQGIKTYEIPPVEKVSADTADNGGVNQRFLNVLLIIGAMFVILAGFIFAAASWGVLGDFFKSAVLLSFSAVFFCVHLIARKKFELDSTGKAFYILGSVFLPASVAAGGILGVFGEYLSFGGGGSALLFTIMFAVTAVSFMIGARIYQSRLYVRIGYICLAAAAAAVMLQGRSMPVLSASLLAVYAIAVLAAEPMVKKREGLYSSEYSFFAAVNTYALAAVSLLLSGGGSSYLLPAVLFSAAMLTGASRSANPERGTAAFAVYLMAGTLSGIRPDSAAGFVLSAAAVSVVYTCLCMMDVFSDRIKDILEKFRFVSGMIITAGGMLIAIIGGTDYHPVSMLISAAAVLVQTVIFAVRRQGGSDRFLCSLAAVWTAYEINVLMSGIDWLYRWSLPVMAAAVFVYFICVTIIPTKKYLSSSAAEAVCCISLLICMFFTEGRSFGCEKTVFVWLLAVAAAVISAYGGFFGRVFLPFAVISSYYPVLCLIRNGEYGRPMYYSAFCIAAVIYCIFACVLCLLSLFRDKQQFIKMSDAVSVGMVPVAIIYWVMSFDNEPNVIVPVMLTVFAAVNMLANKQNSRIGVYSDYFLTLLCFTALEIGRISIEGCEALVFPAAAMLLLFGIYIAPDIFSSKAGECVGGFLKKALPLYSIFMAIYADYESSLLLLICAGLLTFCGCAAAKLQHKCVLMYVNLPLLYICVYDYVQCAADVDKALLTVTLMALAACICGRLLFRKALTDSEGGSDFLSWSAVVVPLLYLMKSDLQLWLATVTALLYVLNLIRPDNSKRFNTGVYTAASLMFMPVWWTQPFFELPAIIRTEWNVLPLVIFAVLIRLIMKNSPKIGDDLSFAAAVIAIVALFGSAFDTGLAADAVILGGVIVLVMVISFLLRQKRWFVLSASAAAIEALFLTLQLWNSRTWWIYLLLAGAAIIGLGMAYESGKRKTDKRSRIKEIMSDWKW